MSRMDLYDLENQIEKQECLLGDAECIAEKLKDLVEDFKSLSDYDPYDSCLMLLQGVLDTVQEDLNDRRANVADLENELSQRAPAWRGEI